MANQKNKLVDSHILENNFYNNIKNTLQNARNNAYRQINFIMVEAYWNIGKQIVEKEQKDKERAEYAKALIKELSKQLTADFSKGFSTQNLWNMRQFYNTFQKLSTLWRELSWRHYKLLIRIKDKQAREWHMQESAKSNWSVKALERQIHYCYYERLLSSQEKAQVVQKAKEKTKSMQLLPKDIIKDPYVLEFLELKDNPSFREADLETALIDKIHDFLLELGRGFTFVARQKRIQTQLSDFYIDLVFYNYILKCFVIIDLKRGKLTHQDIGQIDMYVNMFDELEKTPEDNPTIGIILCADKDNTVVKYSSLKENEQLFISKYQMYLPTVEELKAELERDVLELEMRSNENE